MSSQPSFGKEALPCLRPLSSAIAPPHSRGSFATPLGFPFVTSSPTGTSKPPWRPTPETRPFEIASFPPSVTVWAWISQVLDADHACRKVVARVQAYLVQAGKKPCSEDDSAYCSARKRLPPGVLPALVRQTASRIEAPLPEERLWHGRRVRTTDGATVSMPDTPRNQAAYPQPSSQKPGVGFPIARLVAVFSWATGAVADAAIGALKNSERALHHTLWGILRPGDIALADRGFCSFAEIASLLARGVDSVVRLPEKVRHVDYRRGRRLGPGDHLVGWSKPRNRPPWLSPAEWEVLPATLTVREIRYRIEIPGFRTDEVTVVTTLLDPEEYPVEDLSGLYSDRWRAELNLRHLKTTMQMDVLRGQSPDIVRKEIWAHLLAYNLVRGLQGEIAVEGHASLRRLSFKGVLQRLSVTLPLLGGSAPSRGARLLRSLRRAILADGLPFRPERFEPRVRKRRPKAFPLMSRPRANYHLSMVG